MPDLRSDRIRRAFDMTKQEFLQGLEERLTAEGAFQLVRENREFYSKYIDGEVAKGRTEEEVLEELGDPSLIGRTILEAAGYDIDGVPDTNPGGDANAREQDAGFGNYSGGSSRRYESTMETGGEEPFGGRVFRTEGAGAWLMIGAVILILVLVILFVLGLFWILSPILIPILLVLWIFRLLRM